MRPKLLKEKYMHKTLFVLTLVISLALASCGGAASPTTNIDVTLIDFQFTPNQFTVPAGQEITLNVTNNGAVIHNFIIMNLGQTVGTEFTKEDDANVYWKLEVQAGGSATESFTAPTEPGEYEVVCSTPGHVQAGMVGKLVVVAGE
jgi:uncharacterized cupredoxin-like copper-binding protein